MNASEAQRRAVNKYNATNYTAITVRFGKDEAEEIKDHAKQRGESLNSFFNRAVKAQIAADDKAKERRALALLGAGFVLNHRADIPCWQYIAGEDEAGNVVVVNPDVAVQICAMQLSHVPEADIIRFAAVSAKEENP